MNTSQKVVSRTDKNNDFSFVFSAISGCLGIGIGLIIGSFLGWL